MSRRSAILAATSLMLVVAAGAGAVGLQPRAATAASPSSVPAAARPTAAVERRNLAESVILTGKLAYPSAAPLKGGVAGTVTGLPAEGTILRRGQPTAEIDGQPTGFLLYGDRPAWRALGPGATPGADVLQLKQNLQALGYLKQRGPLTPRWDAATTAAVKAWQKARHATVDGMLPLGSVLFRPGPIRVGTHQAVPGDAVGPGATLYDVTDTSELVTAEMKVALRRLVQLGDPVSLLLPGGATATGKVGSIGAVAHGAGAGAGAGIGTEATVTITIAVDDPAVAASYDQATVSAALTTSVRANVLAVPVTALVALRGGGYAVEVVKGSGTSLIPVTPGLFANGLVEVTGAGLAAGDQVVVAE